MRWCREQIFQQVYQFRERYFNKMVLKWYFVSFLKKTVKIQVSVFKICEPSRMCVFWGVFLFIFLQNNVTSLKKIVNIRKKNLKFVFGSGEQLILYALYASETRLHYEFIKYPSRFFFTNFGFRKYQKFSIILIIPAVRIYHGEGGRTKTKQSCRDFY